VRARRVVLGTTVAVAGVAAAAAIAVLRSGDGGGSAALPDCAQPKATVAPPSRLPATFPFPRGTVFTRSYQNVRSHGVPQAEGRMPLALADATRFFDTRLSRKGYAIKFRRARPGREYTALYEVPGAGGWMKVRPLGTCPGATAFTVSVRPTLLGRNSNAG